MKRILSLVVVLTLLASCFIGVSAEVVAKGDGTKIVHFTPYATEDVVKTNTPWENKTIGTFTVDDGAKLTADEIAELSDHLTVRQFYGNSNALVTVKVIDTNGNLIITTPNNFGWAYGTVRNAVEVSASGTGMLLDYSDLATPVAIELEERGFVDELSAITGTGITIADAAGEIYLDGTATLRTNVTPWNASAINGHDPQVEWTVDNPDVVELGTVSRVSNVNDGYSTVGITAKKVGVATVTVTGDDVVKSVKITVKPILPTKVQIASVSPAVGETVPLRLNWTPEVSGTVTDQTGTWSIVKELDLNGRADNVADISADGKLTTYLAGQVWVRFVANAKAPDGKVVATETTEGEGTLINVSGTPAANAMVTAEYTYHEETEKEDFYFTTSGDNGTILAQSAVKITLGTNVTEGADYEYQIGSAAKANYNGPFEVKEDAVVYFWVNGNAKGYLDITVIPVIEDLTLEADMTTINGTDTANLKATVTGTAANTLEWTVEPATAKFSPLTIANDTTEVTVSAAAGIKDGDKVTYTVTDSVSTKSASVELTWKAAPVTDITINESAATIALNEQLTLKAEAAPANTSDSITYKWESSNTAVFSTAATTSSINVVPLAEGVTTIKFVATAGDKTYTGSCVVTVTPAATKVAAPEYDVEIDETTGDATVTFTTATQGATFEYTIDGGSTQTTNPFPVYKDNEVEIKAKAVKSGLDDSDVVTFTVNTIVPATAIEFTGLPDDGIVRITGTQPYWQDVEAIVKPDLATDKSVEWTWDEEGLYIDMYTPSCTEDIYGLKAGTFTVTATTADGVSASFDVVVEDAKPDHLNINSYPSTIDCGTWDDSIEYEIHDDNCDLPFNQNVTFKSSDESVVTIDETGKLTAVAEGTATITLTAEALDAAGNPVFNYFTITVNPEGTMLKPVMISYQDDYMSSPSDISNSSDVAWSVAVVTMDTQSVGAEIRYTTDGTVPTKDSTLYTGPIEVTEKTTFTAIPFMDGKTSPAKVVATLNFDYRVEEIKLSETSVKVEDGETIKLTFDFLPENAKDAYKVLVKDSNTDSTVADVISGGIDNTNKTIAIETKKPGKTKITFKDGNTPVQCFKPVEVEIEVVKKTGVSVEIADGDQTMSIGDTRTLTALYNNGGSVAFESGDTNVVACTTSGTITALNAGSATISVTYTDKYGDEYTASIAVTVKPDPEVIPAEPTKILSFEPAAESFSAVEGGKFDEVIGTLKAGEGETWDQITYYYNVNVSDSTYTYKVDDQGNVTMLVPTVGAADITASPKWSLTQKSGRGTGALATETRSFNVKITVTKKPTEIKNTLNTFSDPQELEANGSVVVGTIDNYADFKATGVELTAVASVEGFKAEVNDKGEIVISVDGAKPGEYEVYAVVSAEGMTDIKTNPVKVTVKEAPITEKGFEMENGYQDAKGVWHISLTNPNAKIAYNGGTATFALKKASMAKKLTLNADGTMTALKKGTVTLVATVDGVPQNIKVKIEKKAFADPATIKLQYKSGKTWIDVTDETEARNIKSKKSLKIKLVAADGGLIVVKSATFEPAIAGVKAAVKASTTIKTKKTSVGTTTLTIEANGEEFDLDLNIGPDVVPNYIEEPEIEAIEEIEEIEIEEIDE